MTKLNDLFQTQLPMNRKEVFFTATVLPMIIAKDNFQHLHLLFTALDIQPIPEIIVKSPRTNIQFFTEYNLLESLYGTKREQEFQDHEGNLPTGITPDLMILIDSPQNKILLALEAKMYTQPSAADLETQMNKQKEMLDIVKKSLGVEYYHFALLPKLLAQSIKKETPKDGVITWEIICDTFDCVAKDDYFMDILKIALKSYETLVSSYGKNNEAYMTGQEIYDAFNNKTLENQFMGRQSGINGELLKKDLEKEAWKSQKYETRKTELPENRNWFSVEAFVQKIESK